MNTTLDSIHDKMELHVSHMRAFRGQIDACRPTQKEEETLEKANITNQRARSYLVWRRSCLVLAAPFVNTSMLMGFLEFRDLFGGDSALNLWGNFLFFLVAIDDIFMNVGMSVAMHKWSNVSLSMKSLRIGWLLSFVLPLLPALFPLEMMIKEDDLKAVEDAFETQADADAYIFSLKIILAIGYAIQLVPIIVSFPGGAVRGALRILGLLPSSLLPGWLLLVAAPFYSMLVCVGLVVIIQLAGNGLLFFGAMLMVAAPLVYIFKAHLFVIDKTKAYTDERIHQNKMTQRTSATLTAVGLFVLLIWAFTAETNGVRILAHRKNDDVVYFLTWGKGIRMIFEMIGRLLVTTVLFSDIILSMAVGQWREEENAIKYDNFEADMHQLCSLLFGSQTPKPSTGTMADHGEHQPVSTPLGLNGVGDKTERADDDMSV